MMHYIKEVLFLNLFILVFIYIHIYTHTYTLYQNFHCHGLKHVRNTDPETIEMSVTMPRKIIVPKYIYNSIYLQQKYFDHHQVLRKAVSCMLSHIRMSLLGLETLRVGDQPILFNSETPWTIA